MEGGGDFFSSNISCIDGSKLGYCTNKQDDPSICLPDLGPRKGGVKRLNLDWQETMLNGGSPHRGRSYHETRLAIVAKQALRYTQEQEKEHMAACIFPAYGYEILDCEVRRNRTGMQRYIAMLTIVQ
jgi:hypothetical protein